MTDIRDILKQTQEKWGEETVRAIIRKLQSYPVYWKGTLQRSIIYDISGDEVEFFMADYGRFIDEGTGRFGPRKTPIPKSSIPGIAFGLKSWAKSKNLNEWGVATNIVKRGGTKPKPFFKSVIESRIPLLGEAITNAYSEYLKSVVENNK